MYAYLCEGLKHIFAVPGVFTREVGLREGREVHVCMCMYVCVYVYVYVYVYVCVCVCICVCVSACVYLYRACAV